MATDPPTNGKAPSDDPAPDSGGLPPAESGAAKPGAVPEIILPDGAITRAFLAAIGRPDGGMLFRALMDDPAQKKITPQTFVSTFDELEPRLRSASGSGRGIHFQPNIADGSGETKAANIVGATCFFVDFDGAPLANADRLGLAPHVRVETSPGRCHFYWRVEGIPIDQWKPLQKRLIALTESDPGLADLAHLMRLPGFFHWKNLRTPHLTTIVVNEAPPYAFAAFVAALEAAEKARGIIPEPPRKPLPKTIASPINRDLAHELAVAESALRHSIKAGILDLADRSEWIKVGIALKASFGEAGFALWVQLSSEAAGFDGEDECRKQWATFKNDRPPEKQLTIATFIQNAMNYSSWKHPGGGGSGCGNGGGGGDEPGEGSSDPSGGRGGKGKADAATVGVEQAEEAGDEHFLSPEGQAYVRFRRKRPDGTERWLTTQLNGSDYRGVLALRYHEELLNKVAPREQITAAVGLMEARARAANVRHPVYLRSAHHEGRLYVNLNPHEGIVVQIDTSEEIWRIVDDSPVRFITGSRGALPMPERGGTREMFAEHFNVPPDDLTRVLGFLIGVFQPGDAYPLLIVEGEAGGAKSNFGDKLGALGDPTAGRPKAARFSMSTEERNLHVQASRCSVMFFDNISVITAEVADQLSRLSTGASSSFRMHNTMDEEQIFDVVRPVIVTCIATPTSRTDLLSRALRITVNRIEKRRTERAVRAAFEADAGKMLGYLFTCLSTALGNIAAVAAKTEAGTLDLPRMADFAEWVEAAAPALGLKPGDFAKLLCDEQAVVQAAAVQGDPIVDGLLRYLAVAGNETFTVSARGLLDILTPLDRNRDWPHVKAVKGRLQRMAQGLRDSGSDVTIGENAHSKTAEFTFTRNDRFKAAEVPTPPPEDECPF